LWKETPRFGMHGDAPDSKQTACEWAMEWIVCLG
jgi:hypothetical protein